MGLSQAKRYLARPGVAELWSLVTYQRNPADADDPIPNPPVDVRASQDDDSTSATFEIHGPDHVERIFLRVAADTPLPDPGLEEVIPPTMTDPRGRSWEVKFVRRNEVRLGYLVLECTG